jgi:hypothetical protein
MALNFCYIASRARCGPVEQSIDVEFVSVFDLLLLTVCTVNVGAGRKDTTTNNINVHFRLGKIINLDGS